nr:MAG TPA: hypothetical protein [Caudoviricetes sp.]
MVCYDWGMAQVETTRFLMFMGSALASLMRL